MTTVGSTLEGVPWWVGLFLTPLVPIVVRYVSRLLKVEDATSSTERPPAGDSPKTARHAAPDEKEATTPVTSAWPAPQTQPTNPQWELLEGMVGRLQEAHDDLVVANRDLATKAAQQESKILAQQATIDELRATVRALLDSRPPH